LPNNGYGKRQAMSIVGVDDLPRILSPGQRLLGLDLGEKTIGLALTDTLRTVATPLKTLKRGKFKSDAAAIQALIAEHRIGAIIVGLPLNMDGSAGPSAQSAQAFARNFANVSDCPVVLIDERLSTAAVTRTLLDADASRLRRRAVVDKMAAAYVLQGVLDRLARMKSHPST
jgi:putative holliday junction resolvase